MQNMIPNFLKTYSTPRLLQANNTKLQLCYLLQLAIILILFALYAIVYHQAHQQSCPVRGVTTLQSYGGFFTNEESMHLVEKYPNVFQSFWSASDVIERSADGFTVISQIVVTPNQTQSTCPESPSVLSSVCSKRKDEDNGNRTFNSCTKGAQSVSGIQTGECIYNTLDTLKFYDIAWGNPGTTTCEVSGWCPLLPISSGKPYGNSTDGYVLEYSKNLIVLLKTASDFPLCGEKYFGSQNLADDGIPQCNYHPVNNPQCPWFTVQDLVHYAGFISFANVASTGQIFRITVHWDCDFDWKETCIPTYKITPVFGREGQWESYFWENPIYYGNGTRKLVRKFGLKFIIEHEGQGRKTTAWLLMKTFSLGFPYLFIPGFVITLLYNKFFKNIAAFNKKKYYQYSESEDKEKLITISPLPIDIDRLKHV